MFQKIFMISLVIKFEMLILERKEDFEKNG
jgi:hypothetical protein